MDQAIKLGVDLHREFLVNPKDETKFFLRPRAVDFDYLVSAETFSDGKELNAVGKDLAELIANIPGEMENINKLLFLEPIDSPNFKHWQKYFEKILSSINPDYSGEITGLEAKFLRDEIAAMLQVKFGLEALEDENIRDSLKPIIANKLIEHGYPMDENFGDKVEDMLNKISSRSRRFPRRRRVENLRNTPTKTKFNRDASRAMNRRRMRKLQAGYTRAGCAISLASAAAGAVLGYVLWNNVIDPFLKWKYAQVEIRTEVVTETKIEYKDGININIDVDLNNNGETSEKSQVPENKADGQTLNSSSQPLSADHVYFREDLWELGYVEVGSSISGAIRRAGLQATGDRIKQVVDAVKAFYPGIKSTSSGIIPPGTFIKFINGRCVIAATVGTIANAGGDWSNGRWNNKTQSIGDNKHPVRLKIYSDKSYSLVLEC